MAGNTTQGTGASARPRRRWPTVLLAVSLTANLLVLGLVAGAHLRDDRDARRFPPPDRTMLSDSGFRPFFEAMPRDARNALGMALRDRGAVFAPDRDTLAAELREMLAVMRAEPYDPAALEALLTVQHDRVEARFAAGRSVLSEQIATMSPAERRAYADRIEDRFARALEHRPAPRSDRD
ncbi:periplasmic heavy metal sensor [Sinisalibacter aestuarii]|uniref:Periplasmic heavy metal sensor n=1 Tax=Sinisalibacter aestuarii TaxID=2949426 RepID=A0ABQ5LUF3_9RHOB|nr:periplasmic heavy metal sensor [Sinisalibacter aestuarii]GKY88604.1 hypothetical protein STA1M1_24730 [Sinisalibacter aestuarii]